MKDDVVWLASIERVRIRPNARQRAKLTAGTCSLLVGLDAMTVGGLDGGGTGPAFDLGGAAYLAGIRDDRATFPDGRIDSTGFFVGVNGPASSEGAGRSLFTGVGGPAGSGFCFSGIGTSNGSSKS